MRDKNEERGSPAKEREMRTEKFYIDWEKIVSFQSDGEDRSIVYLNDKRELRVKDKFEELMNQKNAILGDSYIVLNLIVE